MTSLCKAISPRSLRFSNYKARFPPKIGRRRVQTRCRRLRAALKRIHLDIASTFDSLSLKGASIYDVRAEVEGSQEMQQICGQTL